MEDLPQTPVKRGRKRKAAVPQPPPPGTEVVDLTADEPTPKAKKRKSQVQENAHESPEFERRARKWRDHPPQEYLTRLARIRSQRFVFLWVKLRASANALVLRPGCSW